MSRSVQPVMKTLARERCRAAILDRLAALRPDSPPRWGRMSAHQMVRHLIDSWRMAIGDQPASSAATLQRRTLVKWLALYVPLRWPAGVQTVPELDQEIGGSRPIDFAADVAELAAQVASIPVVVGRTDWPPHPIFGAMSERAWLRWAWLHIDHHLRQFGA